MLGSQSLTSAGDTDAFVAKFDPAGNLLWAESFGGLGSDQAVGLALDSSGVAFVVGRFSGTVSFDAAHTFTSAGDTDVFVMKLDCSGNVVYATQAGGAGHDSGIGMAVDASGQAYVTGFFAGTANFGATALTAAGTYSGYIAQLDSSGNFTWARQMGGPLATDQLYAQSDGIAIDASGHVFATGIFVGTTAFGDASDGAGATSLTALGTTDAFVTSLDAQTGHFLWTKQLGGASVLTRGLGLALDSGGNIDTVGNFLGQTGTGIDCDPGPARAILTMASTNYFENGYISTLSPTGAFLGAWQVGAPGNTLASTSGVAVGGDGSIYSAGYFTNLVNLDTGTQNVSLTSAHSDGYVSRMTPGQSVILGQVFNDANRNGVFDAGEAPVSGVTVYIDSNKNGKLDRNERSTSTTPQGAFGFYHLSTGSYTIREVVPSGYTLTTPASVVVTVATGQFSDSTAFGNSNSTLSANAIKAVSAKGQPWEGGTSLNSTRVSTQPLPLFIDPASTRAWDLTQLATDLVLSQAKRVKWKL